MSQNDDDSFVIPKIKQPEVVNVVSVRKVRQPDSQAETRTITARVSRYIPPNGPRRVYANVYTDGGRHYVEGAMRPETTSDQLYLCRACGEEGTLGQEWLRHAGFEGSVHCSSCHAAMDEIPWSRKRSRQQP